MGNSQAYPSGSIWVKGSNNLDLDENCKLFKPRVAADVSKFIINPDDDRIKLSENDVGCVVGKIKELFPKTYAILEKLYEGKVAFAVEDAGCSNNLPLIEYDHCLIYYRMPPEYTKLQDTFEEEFKVVWQEEKEKPKKIAQALLDKFA
jgi:hypothetical protein